MVMGCSNANRFATVGAMRNHLLVLVVSGAVACGGGTRSPARPSHPLPPPATPGEPMYDELVAYWDACERDPKAPGLAATIDAYVTKHDTDAEKVDATTKAVFDQRNDPMTHPNSFNCSQALQEARNQKVLDSIKRKRGGQ